MESIDEKVADEITRPYVLYFLSFNWTEKPANKENIML